MRAEGGGNQLSVDNKNSTRVGGLSTRPSVGDGISGFCATMGSKSVRRISLVRRGWKKRNSGVKQVRYSGGEGGSYASYPKESMCVSLLDPLGPTKRLGQLQSRKKRSVNKKGEGGKPRTASFGFGLGVAGETTGRFKHPPGSRTYKRYTEVHADVDRDTYFYDKQRLNSSTSAAVQLSCPGACYTACCL